MKLVLHRMYLKENYTIGKLYLDKGYGQLEWIADTIEDKVRDLTKEKKVYSKTAIPYGEYEITINVVSPKYSNFRKYPKYERYDGKLPRLLSVPMFEGVLIHIGNYGDYTKVLYTFNVDKNKEILKDGTKIKVI